jgi:glyoxylase-like metal-dependent hydrolase (beta-lactamase superfamily II)
MQEICEKVWCIEGLFVNSYVVETGPNSCVIVDCGFPVAASKIRDALREIGEGECLPTAIVLTHGHIDHVGAARELAQEYGIPIFAHHLELPYLDGRSAYPPPDPCVGGYHAMLSRFLPYGPVDLGKRLEMLPRSDTDREGALSEFLPGWRWIFTPGHSPGHIALYREHDRTLIAGDALETTNMDSWTEGIFKPRHLWRGGTPFTCDWDAARESVRALAQLQPTSVCCGHGKPIEDPRVAQQLETFAEHFPVPERGRYVGTPAWVGPEGVIDLPEEPFDTLPLALIGCGFGTLAWMLAGKGIKRGVHTHMGRRDRRIFREVAERATGTVARPANFRPAS